MSKLVKNNNSNNGRAAFDFIAEKVGVGVTNDVVSNVVSVKNNVSKRVKYAACNIQYDDDGKPIIHDRDTFSNRDSVTAKSFGIGWCGSINMSTVQAFHRCGSETAPYLHT